MLQFIDGLYWHKSISMKKIVLFAVVLMLYSCKNENQSTLNDINKGVKVTPISHGSLILEYGAMVVYVDPVGGPASYVGFETPTIVLITDIHGDHLNIETLEGIVGKSTKIVVPVAVNDRLPEKLKSQASVLVNFESKGFKVGDTEMEVEAVPMYNLREEALQFHTKDRGNGYVLNLGGERIYISGDTEDIPEMRQLKNIDKAFVCMNLPWTMPVESAADAVLEFQPKEVYPYHYRGRNGFSNVDQFKAIVNSKNEAITVRLLNWYPDVQ